MKIRFFQLFSLVIIFTLIGAGCSKGLSAEQQASIRPFTLQYWTVANDVETLTAFAKEYRLVRPYVRVEIRQVRPEEFDNLFLNALADDVAPDLVSIHTRWFRNYESRLATMPRTITVSNVYVKGQYSPETIVEQQSIAMPTVTTIRNSFVSTVANDVVLGEQIYGVPLALDTLALYYNKSLLDKAGVPLPPETWEEFLEAIKKSTKFDRDGGILQSGVALGTGNNIPYAFDILSLLMLQNEVIMTDGGYVAFSSGLSNRDITRHPVLEALRFYTDFARPTKEVYSWNEGLESAFDAFTRGKSVFYFGYAADAGRIRARAPQLPLEVIAVPQLNAEAPVNVASYWMESVVKKSKHPNEAWDFLRFITSPDKIRTYTTATRQPSPLRAHIKEQAEDPLLAPFSQTVLTAKNWYHGRNPSAADKAFRDLITAYLKPYAENDEPLKRDANLVIQAAAVVQQTL